MTNPPLVTPKREIAFLCSGGGETIAAVLCSCYYGPSPKSHRGAVFLNNQLRMQTLKIECPCGQHYSFDVEPVNGRMPWAVNCPACGADGTVAANQLLAQSSYEPPVLPKVRVASPVPPVLEEDSSAGYPVAQTYNPQLTAEEAESYGVATNPGRLRPDWGRILHNAPEVWQVPLAFTVAGVLAGVLVHPGFLVLVLVSMKSVWDDYRKFTNLLMSGDVCPAVVISENPGRVAVLTNLSATGGNSPVVRIFAERLSKLAGGPHRRGARLATVAFYLGPIDDAGNWKYFTPEVINKLVSSPADIQRVEDSIPEEKWRCLEACVPRFASRPDGLYALNGQETASMPLFARGERRALWVAGILLAVIALGAVGVIVSPYLKRAGTPASRKADDIRSHFPEPASRPGLMNSAAPSPSGQAMPAPSSQNNFAGISVGDKVEVMDMGRWRPGSVAEINNMRFHVRYDDGSTDQWVMRGQLRSRR
jgi:hypothetical protein